MSLSNFSPSAHNPNATKLQWLCYKKLQLPATDDDDVDNDAARTCPQPQRRPEAIARIEWRWF